MTLPAGSLGPSGQRPGGNLHVPTEWERELGHVREDVADIKAALARLEAAVNAQALRYVSQEQWALWKEEVYGPASRKTHEVLERIERRTSLYLGTLTGALLTGLAALVVRLIVALIRGG